MADPGGLKVDTSPSLSLTASCLGKDRGVLNVSSEGVEQQLPTTMTRSDSYGGDDDDDDQGVTTQEDASRSSREDNILDVSNHSVTTSPVDTTTFSVVTDASGDSISHGPAIGSESFCPPNNDSAESTAASSAPDFGQEVVAELTTGSDVTSEVFSAEHGGARSVREQVATDLTPEPSESEVKVSLLENVLVANYDENVEVKAESEVGAPLVENEASAEEIPAENAKVKSQADGEVNVECSSKENSDEHAEVKSEAVLEFKVEADNEVEADSEAEADDDAKSDQVKVQTDDENTTDQVVGQVNATTPPSDNSNNEDERPLQESPESNATDETQTADTQPIAEKNPSAVAWDSEDTCTTPAPKDTVCDLAEESALSSEVVIEKDPLKKEDKSEKGSSYAAGMLEAVVKKEDEDSVPAEDEGEEEDTVAAEETLPKQEEDEGIVSSGDCTSDIVDTAPDYTGGTAVPQSPAAASQSAQDRVRSYATFKPIAPEESNHDDTKSLVTGRDLPLLEDLSVDTSHESGLSRSADDIQEPILEIRVDDNTIEMEAAMMPRAPNPAVPLATSTCTDSDSCSSASSSSGGSFSFEGQQEPDGDCEFLDQTLNISAIDTSIQQSTSYVSADLPSLVMSAIVQQGRYHNLLNDHQEEDAPGDVMTNESKIIMDHSLVLLKVTESEEEENACAPDSAPTPATQIAEDGLNAQPDFVDSDDDDDADGYFENQEVNISVASLTSYISAEESWQAIELICSQSTSPPRQHAEHKPSDWCAVEPSEDGFCVEASPKHQEEQSTLSKSGLDLNQDVFGDPVLTRLSAGKQPAIVLLADAQEDGMPPTGVSIANATSGKVNDDDTPIARMRSSREKPLVGGRLAADPEGTQPDPSLYGSLKKSPTSSGSVDRSRPRVSFAAMPHYDATSAAPQLLNDDVLDMEEPERRSSLSVDEARRSRFAAYLKRRMIDVDEEEESLVPIQHGPCQLQRCQDGIPKILDPTMCASVESSFTTLVSKADTADDASTMFSALDKLVGASKPKYDQDSGSDSSSCSDSDYSYEDEDAKSIGLFPSFFREADTTRDSNIGTVDPTPKWFDDIALPSVRQLEGILTDFLADSKKQVTQGAQHTEHEALSEFVDELENEEPLLGDDDRETAPQEEESTLAVLSQSQPDAESNTNGDHEVDLEMAVSHEAQQHCGVLTLEDVHELVMMVAAAIDASTKKDRPNQTLSPKTRKSNLIKSSDSTEAAWDRVEHTVNDLESVTGQSVHAKSKTHTRIAAKLEHIKKTQPHVYKVFLAKMAAAERSGRKVDLRRDDVVLRSPPVKGKDLSSSGKAASTGRLSGEPVSSNINTCVPMPDDISVQTPKGSVKIHVESGSIKPKAPSKVSSDWESFDGSSFKDPHTQTSFAADFMADLNDDSSVLDDFEWVSSAKDSFASTMESFIGAPKEMAKPLKEKLAQYSKTHPNLYRILLKKVSERDRPAHASPAPHVDSAKPGSVAVDAVNGTTKSAPIDSNVVGKVASERVNLKLSGDTTPVVGSQVKMTEDDFGSRESRDAAGLPDPNKSISTAAMPISKASSEGAEIASAGTTNLPVDPPSPKKTSILKSASFKLNTPQNDFTSDKHCPQDTNAVQPPSALHRSLFHQPNPHDVPQAVHAIPPTKDSPSLAEPSTKADSLVARLVAREVSTFRQNNERDQSTELRTDLLRRQGSAAKSQDKDALSSRGHKDFEMEGDPKKLFAKKLEFFAKANKSQQPAESNATASTANASRVTSEVSMFNQAKDKHHNQMSTSDGQTLQSSLHEKTDRKLHTRVNESLQPDQERFVQRSQTPLSSNRSGSSSIGNSSKYELTSTPRSSNRSEMKHTRPEVLQNTMSPNSRQSKEESKPRTTAATDSVPLSEEQRKQSCTRAKPPNPNSTAPSQWESFEGTSFKGFVMQSLGRAAAAPEAGAETSSTNSSRSKTMPCISSPQAKPIASSPQESSGPRIDLQATFLDSILPAPPSFHAKSEAHHQQQRHPWNFSEAAGAQWEHFSPTSFPNNFTNRRREERPPSAQKTPGRKRRTRTQTGSSPSSIAEF